MILSGLPAIENLAVFLDEHRNVIEYRGGMPVTNDTNVRSRLAALLHATVTASEISAEGTRKLRAMAEGK